MPQALARQSSKKKTTDAATPTSNAPTPPAQLTISELLASEVALLPKRYDKDIESYLRQLFDKYMVLIGDLGTNEPAANAVRIKTEEIRALADDVLQTLDHYLSGRTSDAYQVFSNAMDRARTWIADLVLPLGELLGGPAEREQGRFGHLYRLRTGPLTQYKQQDLFHIPFEKRQLVGSQRYSIPGLPSLYLGSSLWISWEELGRPDFSLLHASRFEGSGHLRVLDFGWSTSLAKNLSGFAGSENAMELFGKFTEGQAIIWPLIAACSLVRRHPGTPFAPEYIIPHFVLQWVRKEKDLDGIRYFSTRVARMDNAANRAFNYVFPVRQKAPEGICGELRQSFALTPPISWAMLQSWKPRNMSPHVPSAPGAIDFAENMPIRYTDTDFFTLEDKLEYVPASTIA